MPARLDYSFFVRENEERNKQGDKNIRPDDGKRCKSGELNKADQPYISKYIKLNPSCISYRKGRQG